MKIRLRIFLITIFILSILITKGQVSINSIHEYDLVELEIEGKILGGVRNNYLFQELASMKVNISRSILIQGLFDTLLQMRLHESREGIVIYPDNAYVDNSTGLIGETLIFNITVNHIYHSASEDLLSDESYENPKLSQFSDFIQGFGLIISIIILTVLFKAIFDYIKIRNQSQLIIR